MNNRYIFRGKRKDTKEWVYSGIYYQKKDELKDEAVYIITGSLSDIACAVEVIPETVGQCSGVPDKNGTLMYEGDIVNALFDFGMPIKSICAFRNGAFGLLAKQHGAEHFHPFTSLCNIKYEVVGNVYDALELLEEK